MSWYVCAQRQVHTHVMVLVCAEAGGVGCERMQWEEERNAIFK